MKSLTVGALALVVCLAAPSARAEMEADQQIYHFYFKIALQIARSDHCGVDLPNVDNSLRAFLLLQLHNATEHPEEHPEKHPEGYLSQDQIMLQAVKDAREQPVFLACPK